ncbi:MAG: hypothetical protein IJH40_03605 [Ruminococcus sp.]|uniref:DUF5684 domain-containing protein n=1 Tax=Ruminococcus sp. TaxID=41978 RepID=UPI002872C6D5|nr:DUF5684 domain-containing protein [Ruminococcus sp.]MBQ3284706.1 hypothetical protein [Ruminococcus sp.]MBQ3329540.1 hypothetical protein [Ruminococcus sp.]
MEDFETYFSTPLAAAATIVILIIVLLIYVLFVVAEWRILTKAGEKGWKALIPIYNIYVSHHIVGMSHAWFIAEVIIWVIEILFEVFEGIPDWIGLVFGIAVGIFTLISELIHILKICTCFGKGTGFKIGMILIPDLFLLILAFGKSEFKKAE